MKVYAIVAGLIVTLVAVKLFGDWRYDAGWNAHSVASDSAIEEARSEAVKQAKEAWERSARIGEAEIIVEEKIVERVRNVERRIPIVLESVPVCARDVGAEFVRLLNDQIRASALRSDGAADPPSAPDSAVRTDAGIPVVGPRRDCRRPRDQHGERGALHRTALCGHGNLANGRID